MMAADNPVSVFEAFVTEGGYLAMKQHEAFLKQAKAHLRKELSDSEFKRHVYPKVNMVAKFVAKEIRTINEEGIIEDLFNYVRPELALALLSLDPKKLKNHEIGKRSNPYKLPATHYVRPYLNKVGKSHVKVRDYLFGGQSIPQLLTEINKVTNLHKEVTAEYEKVKETLFTHLNLIKKNNVKTEVGSISRISHQPKWDMNAVLENLGEEYIQLFGKLNLTLLDEWIISGTIPRSVLTNNRTVVDIRLDFIVIPLDVEARVINFSNRKRSNLSLRLYA